MRKDLACEAGHHLNVEMLLGSGAILHEESYTQISDEEQKLAVCKSVLRGTAHRVQSQNKMTQIVTEQTRMVGDLCSMVTNYIPGFDVLQILNDEANVKME